MFGEVVFENEIAVDKDFDGYITLPLKNIEDYNRIFIEIEKNSELTIFDTKERITGAPEFEIFAIKIF